MFDQPIDEICNNEQLAILCQRLQSKKLLAVDTEFIRIRTFYPKPALFQVNDGERISLIDPLVIDLWQPFIEVLENQSIVKILHACDEDIELFYHFLKCKVRNVFDTQVAAAFCGFDYSMGYQRLIVKLLDVDLEKESSRSDWLQRPISEKQRDYAANDVRYLLYAYELLRQTIADNHFQIAVAQEYDAVVSGICNQDFSDAIKRVKQAGKLRGYDYAVLEFLAIWREKMMRKYDFPRNKVAKNDALMMLSRIREPSVKHLFTLADFSMTIARSEGDVLIEQIIELRESPLKSQLKVKFPNKANVLQALKQALLGVGNAYGLAEHLLSKKRINECLVIGLIECGGTGVDLGDYLSGWRLPFYQQALDRLPEDMSYWR